jgi:hypothetical protein
MGGLCMEQISHQKGWSIAQRSLEELLKKEAYMNVLWMMIEKDNS